MKARAAPAVSIWPLTLTEFGWYRFQNSVGLVRSQRFRVGHLTSRQPGPTPMRHLRSSLIRRRGRRGASQAATMVRLSCPNHFE